MYSIIWKYKIYPEHKDIFEKEYGTEGTWNTFFRASEKYNRSELFQSHSEADTYLLVEEWNDEQAYRTFITLNQDEYERLSSEFEHLYSEEHQVGTFIILKD